MSETAKQIIDDELYQDLGLPPRLEGLDGDKLAEVIAFPLRRRDQIALEVIDHPRRSLIPVAAALAVAGFATAKAVPKIGRF